MATPMIAPANVPLAYPESMMRQAGYTAEAYLRCAIETIDEQLGKGYAAKHPELIGAFIRTCAQDFDTAMMQKRLEELAGAGESIADAIGGLPMGDVADKIGYVGTAIADAAESVQNIAAMLDLHGSKPTPSKRDAA